MPQNWVENQTPEHVPCYHVSACIRRVPVLFPPGTKSTWGLAEVHWTFFQYSPISDSPILRERSDADSESTPNLRLIFPPLGNIWYSLCSGVSFHFWITKNLIPNGRYLIKVQWRCIKSLQVFFKWLDGDCIQGKIYRSINVRLKKLSHVLANNSSTLFISNIIIFERSFGISNRSILTM